MTRRVSRWWMPATFLVAGCTGNITAGGLASEVEGQDPSVETALEGGAAPTDRTRSGWRPDPTPTTPSSNIEGEEDQTSSERAGRSERPNNVPIPAQGCDGERPLGNDGIGFFVADGQVYDPNGCPFLARGFNGLVFWNTTSGGSKSSHEEAHLASIQHMADAGANTLRIVTQVEGSFGWNTSAERQRDIVQRSLDAGIVPIMEMHNATCDDDISQIRPYWESPEMVQLAKDYEDILWINIANEHNFASPEAWRDYYIATIQSLRDRGVKNPIMLDAGNRCGQDPEAILTYGHTVLEADPQKNVIFSFHVYGMWISLPYNGGGWVPPFELEQDFKDLAGTGLPLFIGEFGWDNPSNDLVAYDPRLLIDLADEHGIGWTFWSWFEDAPQFKTVTNLDDPTSLSAAGQYIVPYLQDNAKPATVF